MPRTWGLLATLAVLLAADPGLAGAQDRPPAAAESVEGRIVEARSRWAGAGSRIVTESTLETDDGRRIRLRQLGGSVDGIGMRVIPSSAPLRLGDRVAVTTAEADSRGRYRVETADVLVPGRLDFVRTMNSTEAALYWSSGCVFVSFDTDGTTHIDNENEVMTAALQAWEQAFGSCSYMTFVIDEPGSYEVGFDRRNVIKFREGRWCRPEAGDDPEECYDSSAAGLTTLFFIDDRDSKRNGQILDADIELNAVDFAISDGGQSNGPPTCLSDLANTFTHEVGHLLGLDHTCWVGVGARPVDGDGNPVPSCNSQLDDALTEATMFNFQDCGETKKATVEADDIAGVCAIYGNADDPSTCEPVGEGGGCCSASGSSGSLGGALALCLLCAFGLRRRRSADRSPL